MAQNDNSQSPISRLILQPAPPEIADFKTKFLIFDEAVCLLAFGSYQFPAWGPNLISSITPSDAELEIMMAELQGKYDLAYGQLLGMGRSGKIRFYGELEEGSYEVPSNRQWIPLDRIRQIPPEELMSQDFEEDRGNFFCANRWYRHFVVPYNDVELVASWLRPDTMGAVNPIVEERTSAVHQDSESIVSLPRPRGRPREWDWDAIFGEIVRIANLPDGLPESQADLQRMVATYCVSEWGREPAPSTLSEKIGKLYSRSLRKIP